MSKVSTMSRSTDAPATLLDFLIYQLDRKLAEQYSEQARYRLLLLQGRLWRQRFIEFAEDGTQPFGGPHPDFGVMDAFDFRLLLSEINERMSVLERAQVA